MKTILTPDFRRAGPQPAPADFRDIFQASSSGDYSKAIDQARLAVTRFLKENRKPFSGISPAALGRIFEEVDFDTPLPDYESLFAETEKLYVRHATAFHLPRYMAHLNCPVLIPALAAEVLISAINSSQDTYDQSAGGTLMERKLIAWTGAALGFGPECDGVFTGGGSQSNLMGLLLARDHYTVSQLNYRIKELGNPPEASRFRVFVSEKAHFSNQKNAWLLGLGEQSIVQVKTDARFRMDSGQLEEAILREKALGNLPIAIVATAGTTDFGNLDPLADIAVLARKYALWYHVDAAYGCGLLLSAKYGHLLQGIEAADSVTVDYHKSFFQPISSSAFLVKDKRHLQLIRHHADYLNPQEQDYEELPAQINKSITQSTRRFDALKLWFSLRLTGRKKLGEYTDTIIETAKAAAEIIAADTDFELLSDSDLGVLVFRYVPELPAGTSCCQLNQYIKKALFSSGEAMVASTKVNHAFYLKFTILNPVTTTADIRDIIQLIKTHGNAYPDIN